MENASAGNEIEGMEWVALWFSVGEYPFSTMRSLTRWALCLVKKSGPRPLIVSARVFFFSSNAFFAAARLKTVGSLAMVVFKGLLSSSLVVSGSLVKKAEIAVESPARETMMRGLRATILSDGLCGLW